MPNADNSLVTPIVFNLPKAINARTQDKEQISPRGIPATISKLKGEGQIVVKIAMTNTPYKVQEMTIPGAYSQYIRPGFAVGDKGYIVNGDYNLHGQSNNGATPGFHYDSNLTNAVFMPISNTKWPKADRDMGTTWINGPNGSMMSDIDGTNLVHIDVQNKRIAVKADPSWQILLGGDGTQGTFAVISTVSGPALPNIKARIS